MNFETILGAEHVFNKIKSFMWNATENGTGRKLRTSGVFSTSTIVYSKTGTIDVDDNEHTFIIFGTENYSYGIFLYNQPSTGEHARDFAVSLVKCIKNLFLSYVQ